MTGSTLAWTGLAAGAGVLGAVAVLLTRTVRPTLEIVRYAEDIAASIDTISDNLSGGAQLLQTRELALAVPELTRRLTSGAA